MGPYGRDCDAHRGHRRHRPGDVALRGRGRPPIHHTRPWRFRLAPDTLILESRAATHRGRRHTDPTLGRQPGEPHGVSAPGDPGVREAVGPDFVVGIRMSLDEAQPGGPTFDEALTAAERYAADGIDLISAIHGSIESDASLAKAIPSIGTPLGPFPDFTDEIKRRLSVPRDARGAHRRRRHRAARSA